MPARAWSARLGTSSAGATSETSAARPRSRRTRRGERSAADTPARRAAACPTSRRARRRAQRKARLATRAQAAVREFASVAAASRRSSRSCSGWPASSASTARQRSCSLARICCCGELEQLVVDRSLDPCRCAPAAAHRGRASARSRRCRGSSRAARRAHSTARSSAGSAVAQPTPQSRESNQ